MSDAPRILKRILVALDAATFEAQTLEAAAALAAQLRAELHGLFIEDVNLLNLAGLPFAQETSFSAPLPRPLNLESMERMFRLKAHRAREQLADLAGRARISWSFHVARGHTVRGPLDAAGAADLLLLGTRPFISRSSPPSAVRSAHSVTILVDGELSCERLIEVGSTLCAESGAELQVLLFPADPATAAHLRTIVQNQLERRRIPAVVRSDTIATFDELLAELRRRQPRILLLCRQSPWLDAAALESLVARSCCPIGLVC